VSENGRSRFLTKNYTIPAMVFNILQIVAQAYTHLPEILQLTLARVPHSFPLLLTVPPTDSWRDRVSVSVTGIYSCTKLHSPTTKTHK